MENTALIALALIAGQQYPESRSALPDAPVVDDSRARRAERLTSARRWLAMALRRMAWAVEPEPLVAAASHA